MLLKYLDEVTTMRNMEKHGRYHNVRTLYPLLGMHPGQHITNWFAGWHMVDGICYYVHLDHETPARAKKGARKPHRIYYRCPICDQYYPFGRRGQHEKACVKAFNPL